MHYDFNEHFRDKSRRRSRRRINWRMVGWGSAFFATLAAVEFALLSIVGL